MKKALIVFLLCAFGARGAVASEFILNAPTLAPFIAVAKSAGYWDATTKTIVPQGRLTTHGGGEYVFNLVGPFYYPDPVATTVDAFGNTVPVMVAAPGVYARLRNNADDANLPGGSVDAAVALAKAAGVTVYVWRPAPKSGAGCWSSDNATCGPAWLANVANIS